MSTYARDTIVIVEPFTSQPDGDEVIIGKAETGVFLAVPAEAIELLEHFSSGGTVGEAADNYQKKYGAVPDLNDFLSFMESKGLVRLKAQEGDMGQVTGPISTPIRKYHFANVPQKVAQRIFSRPVLTSAYTLIAIATAIVFLNPALFPRSSDLYFPDHRTLIITLLTVVSYITVFLHELAHLLAARSLGVNSRIGIGHRLWYLVAETDLTGLWTVPSKKRYLPMFAGVLLDLTSASLLVLLLLAQEHHILTLPILLLRMVRAVYIAYLLRVAWQFFFYIRTDFYYVIANFFNCRNLLGDTQVYLRNQMAKIFHSIPAKDQSAIPTPEFRIIRAYSVIWVAGRIFAFYLLFGFTLPIIVQYVRGLTSVLRAGYSTNSYNFLDALLLSAYFLVPVMIGFAMWITSLVRHERG